MRKLIVPCLAATIAIAGFAVPPAHAQSLDDQSDARREMQAGNQLRLADIERRVVPTMRGAEYIGPAYDSTAKIYRLKFIRNGRVIFVDVDARTGRVVRRSR
ncbi:PepSY domain-containing protein [Pelagerythrobacter marinus]|jgi:hypothetical protein|uniref:PepSY domain-containing protein n=1 Tax=Pelagerythrobacter marinus TaxID=538382 RepID=A0ABW9UVW5_9SPHN|nr:PepSY domain-containing protein [Pelagerythrobacter marinus]MXO68052.1 hypothetical protein [Pelagerythrobacter marinus]USA40784.1 PepSY domain-containing protein [Pelagerythrobacter marinus]WPZ08042.1 PepSY domain-containing protein [Pelagerythrobacter marinus]